MYSAFSKQFTKMLQPHFLTKNFNVINLQIYDKISMNKVIINT